jgi:hypothetical protein
MAENRSFMPPFCSNRRRANELKGATGRAAASFRIKQSDLGRISDTCLRLQDGTANGFMELQDEYVEEA